MQCVDSYTIDTVTYTVSPPDVLTTFGTDVPYVKQISANDGVVSVNHCIVKNPLTPSESRIVALGATGLSMEATGSKLYMSKETVRTHRKNAFKKLDVGSMAEAVTALFASDIYTVDCPITTIDILPEKDLRIISMISCGKSRKNIGRRLGLSEHTIAKYVPINQRKLHAANRSAAIFLGHLSKQL